MIKKIRGWLWLMGLGIVITAAGAAFLSFLEKGAEYLRPVGWAALGVGILTIVLGVILGPGRIKRAEDKTKTDDAGFKLIIIGLGANILGAALLSILDKDTRDLLPLGWALLVIGIAAMVAGVVLCMGAGKPVPEAKERAPKIVSRRPQKRY